MAEVMAEVMAVPGARGNLEKVQHVVLVLSGKGGVGKSTITTELALALLHSGKKVGVLDVDLCGPSIPRMLGVSKHEVHQCDAGWVPVCVERLSLMSIAFLLDDPDDAIIWRGPKKTALIGQFVSDVAWGELDVLLVDTPPGTSDEHLAVLENLKKHRVDGALLVTTPQVCTHTHTLNVYEYECTSIFSKGGGEELAKLTGSTFLGSVPLDPLLSASVEEGGDFLKAFPESAIYSSIRHIADTLLRNLEP
ncbi:cytosolic Fe-S cluster assembly factor nubp2 isoform 1 [Silurus meridionalis]|nr:cytosolic Fe-S cluster assembly factor nubp2 isoform 1 [Silurus meridionalis]